MKRVKNSRFGRFVLRGEGSAQEHVGFSCEEASEASKELRLSYKSLIVGIRVERSERDNLGVLCEEVITASKKIWGVCVRRRAKRARKFGRII